MLICVPSYGMIEAPDGARWMYACVDVESHERMISGDWKAVETWMSGRQGVSIMGAPVRKVDWTDEDDEALEAEIRKYDS